MGTPLQDLSVDTITEYIARGHAFNKHLEGIDPRSPLNGQNAFRATSPNVGPDLGISNADDLQDYIKKMIGASDTVGFTDPKTGGITLFNETDKTILQINPFDGQGDFGSIYRYPNSATKYDDMLDEARKLAQSPSPTFKGRFLEFDNAQAPNTILDKVDNFINDIKARPAHWNSARTGNGINNILSQNPGESALAAMPGRSNQAATGMSDMYTTIVPDIRQNMPHIRSALDDGAGFVVGTNARGNPNHMFFVDNTTGNVVEMNGSAITLHKFDNIPDVDRASHAKDFIVGAANKLGVENVLETSGGYTGLAKAAGLPGNGISSVDAIAGKIANGTATFADAGHVFENTQDMARVALGLTAAETDLLKNLPTELTADALNSIDDPAVRSVLSDLVDAKGLSLTDDAGEAVDLFKDVLRNADPAVVRGATEALQTIDPSAIKAMSALDDLADLLRIVRGAKAAKAGASLTKNGVVTTVVATVASIALTKTANAMSMDIAEQLETQNELPDGAYEAYQTMMDDVGGKLELQSADPTPVISLFTMAAVEKYAYDEFQKLSNEYKLPQHVHELLSPGIVAGTSIRGDIGENTFKIIPDDPSAASPLLQDLIAAKQDVVAADDAYWNERSDTFDAMPAVPMPMGISFSAYDHPSLDYMPNVVAAQKVVDQAEMKFQFEFDKLLSDPNGAHALAELLSKDQLFDIVEQTATFNRDHQNPLIQQYVSANDADAAFYDLSGMWKNMQDRGAAESALRNNPDAMREYLADIFARPEPIKQSLPEVDLIEDLELETQWSTPEDITMDPNYIAVAIAIQDIRAGEPLNDFVKDDIKRILESEQTDPEVLKLIEEQYGAELDESLLERSNISTELPNFTPIEQPLHSTPITAPK